MIATRVGQTIGLVLGTPSPDEIFWAIRRLFEALARSQPLVLMFDDIHWAEPTLLDLIEHVADRSRDAPMMLICMARPELLDVRSGVGRRGVERHHDPPRTARHRRRRRQ